MEKILNPIIPGFYPDPSIIRVEDNFFIVNSSFEYFPAIPVWQSKDLKNWKQIANAINRVEQNLDLQDVNPSGGVQAATIRHHDGIYYITSTRIKKEWPRLDYHFVITAKDPAGPWSECHFIEDAEGIDSSLFFDDDGKAYFLANRQKENAESGNDTEIWICEFDLNNFKLIGQKHAIWGGTGGIYPEGPRLFKKNGFCHLLIAEGGTLHNHTTTFARSNSVFGPYESSSRNPVMTHRFLEKTYPIQNVGHADMVELEDGSWWGVCLGSRPRGGFYEGGNTIYSFGGYYRNLGRETFLFPIVWPPDNLSPVFSPATNKIDFEYESNLPPVLNPDVSVDFSAESLSLKWLTIAEPAKNLYARKEEAIVLNLQDSFEKTFFGYRQVSWRFKTSFIADFENLKNGDCFRFVAQIKPDAYLALNIQVLDGLEISCFAASGEQFVATTATSLSTLTITLTGNDQDYTFSIPELEFSHKLDGREISCDMTDSHTGVLLGFSGVSQHGTSVEISKFMHQNIQDS